MAHLKRREWMRRAAATLVAAAAPASRLTWAASPVSRDPCSLSIGTYGLKGVPLERAIRLVAETGYDGIELAVQPGFGAGPAKLSHRRRGEVRSLLAETGLKLTALMEQLYPARDER